MVMFEDGSGECPNCNRYSGFERLYWVRVWPELRERTSRSLSDLTVWVEVVVYKCLFCNKTVVLRDQVARIPDSVARETGNFSARRIVHRELIYPSQTPRALHESVPEAVRSLYAEASECEQAGALRAAGVMYRASVEELVKHQKAEGANLYKKIESLKGQLDDELVEDLHQARIVGNDSIHAGIDYSADEVADIAGLIEEATVALYVQPEQKRQMRDARKARREAVKKES